MPERIYFCTFLHCLYVRNTKVTFAEKTEIENKQLKNMNILFILDQTNLFKGAFFAQRVEILKKKTLILNYHKPDILKSSGSRTDWKPLFSVLPRVLLQVGSRTDWKPLFSVLPRVQVGKRDGQNGWLRQVLNIYLRSETQSIGFRRWP